MKTRSSAADVLGDLAEVKTYPIGHFDIYEGTNFEVAMDEMLSFTKKHLK